jgi:Cyclin
MDRLCSLYSEFSITSLTIHRFLVAAATVAAKGLSDSYYCNSMYAQVGGIRVTELSMLELELLCRVDWKIVPCPEVLVDYYCSLVARADGYILERNALQMGGGLSCIPQREETVTDGSK